MPGSTLEATLNFVSSAGMADRNLELVLADTSEYCKQQGATWYNDFYDTTVACSWQVEDECRSEFCTAAAGSALIQCLTRCISYASNDSQQVPAEPYAARVLVRINSCMNTSRPFVVAPPAKTNDIMSTEDGIIQMYSDSLYMSRTLVVAGSESASLASTQAEYVVGALVSLVAGKYLLPSAISLLGGLAEALINMKAMFPGSQHGAWILILTTLQVVPVYASFLSLFQQLLGDEILAIACVMTVLFTSLSILTGVRLLNLQVGDEEREKMYTRIRGEYGLRLVCAVSTAGAIVAWANRKHKGLNEYVEYVLEEILTPEVIAIVLIDAIARKIMTAVAGTDFVLGAFVSTEAWYIALPQSAKERHTSEVQEVDFLYKSSRDEKAGFLSTHGGVVGKSIAGKDTE